MTVLMETRLMPSTYRHDVSMKHEKIDTSLVGAALAVLHVTKKPDIMRFM